ncbi:MAG: family 20 glycosylhydrolase [bacterium]|nr:family 20 glycosylhydrolase [bacterium]
MPRQHRVVIVLLAAWPTGAARAADEPKQVLEVGSVRVTVEPWNRGVSIAVDDVAVSSGSNLVVTKPPWAPHYYLGPSPAAVRNAVQEQIDGAQRLRMRHEAEDGSFVGEDIITVTPDRRVERVLEGRFLRDGGEALVQWMAGALNPALVIGRPYRVSPGADAPQLVPVVAASPELEPSTLAAGFSSLRFASRLGPIEVSVESNRDLICYDHRKSRWSDPANPFFWLGDLGSRLRQGEPARYRIVFRLPPPKVQTAEVAATRAVARVRPHADAQTHPLDQDPRIIPRPKDAAYGPVSCDITHWLSPGAVRVSERPPEAESAVRLLHDILTEFARRHAMPTGRPNGEAVPLLNLAPGGEGWSLPEGGYELSVSVEGIEMRAADASGFRHAVQTLKQLLARTSCGRVIVRGAQIRDWPSLKFRGVHLFTGGQGAELHGRLFRDVLAACKMNRVVLEAEYVEWESHPEIHHPEYGMPKGEVRQLLKLADELGLEVIPLVMSLGHCQWIFETGHNLDIAEDPDAKWAYCVTNPKTYEFIYDIYSEAVELFQPSVFHIGHDEFHHRGRVPFRESSKPYTVEELFTMDTLRHHQWFADRGIRMMMWGDMLLGKEEGPDACHAASIESAKALRQKLPKDVLVADWHYVAAAPEKFTNLDAFRSAGYDTVAATWYRPGNVTGFARAAYDKKALGLLQTTWAGYSLDPGRFEKQMHQYAAYVLAAEAAWNADRPPDPNASPFVARFLDLMGMSSLRPAHSGGWTADLTDAYNYPLAAADANGWFGLGPDHDLSTLPRGNVRMHGVRFDLGSDITIRRAGAIALTGRLAGEAGLPGSVEIELGHKAHRLVFLHATNFPAKAGTRVGTYRLTYDDGQTAEVDVVYGRNVFAYTDMTAAPDAPLVWRGRNAAGQQVALHGLVWAHPYPGRTIRSVTLESSNAEASLMVIGLTGLGDER